MRFPCTECVYIHPQIIAFPCNQFGAQEPDTASHVLEWTRKTYNVHFTIMDKVDVTGTSMHPVWRWLSGKPTPTHAHKHACAEHAHTTPTWNFYKYLISEGM